MQNKELLSPAGNFEKMTAALRYGADAVYLSGRRFGMRAAADNFSSEEIYEAVKYAHSLDKKVYVTVNTMPRTDEYPSLEKYLAELKESKPDALIIADPGVMELAKSIMPEIPIHVSTQTGIVSAADCLFYAKTGATRVVLARELSFEEIAQISEKTRGIVELECFVHGSMCVSFSGRCLLSEHYTGRDANRGACAQPCRWNFNAFEISEEKRPGDRLTVNETPDGTFIMSSKDMCMIEHIPELMESGIHSFKIEGRMKSAYYTAVCSNVYSMAMKKYLSDPKNYSTDSAWLAELEGVSHREYCTGYFFDDPMKNAQLCENPGYIKEKAYLATVTYYKDGIATLSQRNKMCEGDNIEIISPGRCGTSMTVPKMKNEKGEDINSTPHPYMTFTMPVPFECKAGDIVRSAV